MSKHSSVKKRAVEIVAIAGVAGTVVACGGKAVEMVGTVMEDAGRAMTDAGAAMADAGAQWLSDAGEVMADAGREMRDASGQMAKDADAQDTSCGTCTASGARRVIVASEDPERLLGGMIAGADWTKTEEAFAAGTGTGTAWFYHSMLGNGPLVVTDVLASAGSVSLFAVPAGTPCFERAVVSEPLRPPLKFRIPTTARPLLGASTWALTGSRLFVKGGESLCASAGGGDTSGTVPAPAQVTWTGFRPYE